MTAICSHEGHGDCRMLRSLRPHPRRRAGTINATAGQGRPVGLLVLWLQAQHDHGTQQGHMHRFQHSHARRLEARLWLYDTLSLEDFGRLQQIERQLDDGEGTEPEKIR